MMIQLQIIAKEQGRSVVIVSHDQRIQDIADRVLWLIRYELGDIVRLATDPCPSEHPFALIDDIQGRVEDVLSFQGVAGGGVNV